MTKHQDFKRTTYLEDLLQIAGGLLVVIFTRNALDGLGASVAIFISLVVIFALAVLNQRLVSKKERELDALLGRAREE